jgi:hypothetical protein
MFTRTKRLFQLSLITVFAAVLFLGTAGVNTALADHTTLDIKVVIKEECHNGTDKPTKRTIKSAGTLQIDPTNTNLQSTNACGNACDTPYPSWDSITITIADFDGVAISETFSNTGASGEAGVALTKNLKSGKFQTTVDNVAGATVGDRVLSLSGSVVSDKKLGDLLKMVGKINGTDNTLKCTYVGKLKGKPQP